MKNNRHGQGKILSPEELKLLFTEGLTSPRDRALFAICLFTGCRISEALALQTTDIKSGTITFRKSTTKGKLKTRVVDIQPALAAFLDEYQPKPGALFPGMRGVTEHLTKFMAHKILVKACDRLWRLSFAQSRHVSRCQYTFVSTYYINYNVFCWLSLAAYLGN